MVAAITAPHAAPAHGHLGARRRPRPGGVKALSDADAGLVARWQAGDASAFEALVRRHERRVYRLALRMLGDRQEAEDVAQEAFLSLHRHGHRFRGEARFSTFVYRVTVNAALNRRRSLGRGRGHRRELAEGGAGVPVAERSPEDAALGSEARVRVQAALLELPAELRLAVVLYDLEGLPYGQIARVLEIPVGTVKSRIHRGRGLLRERLAGFIRGGHEGVAV